MKRLISSQWVAVCFLAADFRCALRRQGQGLHPKLLNIYTSMYYLGQSNAYNFCHSIGFVVSIRKGNETERLHVCSNVQIHEGYFWNPTQCHRMSSKVQLKCLIPWASNMASRTWRSTISLATKRINAIAAEPTNALGTCIAISQHADPGAAGTVDLNGLLESGGCASIRR